MTYRKSIAGFAILCIVFSQGTPAVIRADEAPESSPPVETSPAEAPAEPSAPSDPSGTESESEDTESAIQETTSDTPPTPETNEGATNEETVEIVTDGETTEAEVTETAADVVGAVADSLEAGIGGGGVASEGTSDGPIIVSGEAVATANILNIVNTNVVNSTGAIVFSNLFGPSGDIDFRDLSTTSDGVCFMLLCGFDVNLSVINDAFIDNFIRIFATSGSNTIESEGDAAIDTGNAYAGLNLVNIANSNFVDSNYLLITLNAFQGVDGDIIFPNLGTFLGGAHSQQGEIALTNEADVVNDVTVESEAGNNAIENADGTIETGDAISSSNVFNQLNGSLIGGGSLMLIFRVHGNWAGEVFGAPPTVSWSEAPDGSIFLYETGSASSTDSVTDVTATSTALIRNDVSVIALTGENKITDAKTALISTGDAVATANIMNVANQNIIGRNIIWAIIDIFGDFNGNISFGRPDLWVGEQINAPTYPQDGSELTYKFSIINNGDLEATGVKLVDDYDATHIEILESSLAYTMNSGGDVEWDIGTLGSGLATEISYRARIKNAPPGTNITNTVKVTGTESDNNLADNSDTATVTTMGQPTNNLPAATGHPCPSCIYGTSLNAPHTDFTVKRDTATTTLLFAPVRKSRQEFRVTNTSGHDLPKVVVHDVMRDPDGNVVGDEVWNLGTMKAGEEVRIGYNLSFAANAPWGEYALSTLVGHSETGQQSAYKNGWVLLVPQAAQFPTAPFTSDAPLVKGAVAISIPTAPDPKAEEPEVIPPTVTFVATNTALTASALPARTFPGSTLAYLLPLILGGFGIMVFGAARRRNDRSQIDI